MHKEPPNYTSSDSCLVLANKTVFVISESIRKIAKNIYIIYICLSLYNVVIYHKGVGFGHINR